MSQFQEESRIDSLHFCGAFLQHLFIVFSDYEGISEYELLLHLGPTQYRNMVGLFSTHNGGVTQIWFHIFQHPHSRTNNETDWTSSSLWIYLLTN